MYTPPQLTIEPKPETFAKCFQVSYTRRAEQYSSVSQDNPGKDWEYFKVNPPSAAEFVPSGDGLFEMVVPVGRLYPREWCFNTFYQAKATEELAVINTTYRGHGAYATHDAFVPHPEKPGWWKILGRIDDQLMLSTGETVRSSFFLPTG